MSSDDAPKDPEEVTSFRARRKTRRGKRRALRVPVDEVPRRSAADELKPPSATSDAPMPSHSSHPPEGEAPGANAPDVPPPPGVPAEAVDELRGEPPAEAAETVPGTRVAPEDGPEDGPEEAWADDVASEPPPAASEVGDEGAEEPRHGAEEPAEPEEPEESEGAPGGRTLSGRPLPREVLVRGTVRVSDRPSAPETDAGASGERSTSSVPPPSPRGAWSEGPEEPPSTEALAAEEAAEVQDTAWLDDSTEITIDEMDEAELASFGIDRAALERAHYEESRTPSGRPLEPSIEVAPEVGAVSSEPPERVPEGEPEEDADLAEHEPEEDAELAEHELEEDAELAEHELEEAEDLSEVATPAASPPPPPADAQELEAHDLEALVEKISSRPPPPPEEVAPPKGPPEQLLRKRRKPWFEEFFNDDYLRTVRPFPDRFVKRQVDFIEQQLGLEKGATVLDVGCGLGLHAVELAERGYLVVGLDLSLPMLSRAADEAQDRGLKINFLHADMREMNFEGAFDAVLCWGTTFGYFDEDSNRRVVDRLFRALKPMGLLLLDVINRDHVIRSQPNLVWFEGDGCVCMEETNFNYITSRLEVKRTVILDDGRQRENVYSIRLYPLHELGQLLHQQGFRVASLSGHEAHPGVFFGADSPRMIIMAERRLQGRSEKVPPPPPSTVSQDGESDGEEDDDAEELETIEPEVLEHEDGAEEDASNAEEPEESPEPVAGSPFPSEGSRRRDDDTIRIETPLGDDDD